jgi:hypothetical protein
MSSAAEAFGLEEALSTAPKRRPNPPPEHRYGASPISERNLHSDRYMDQVRANIPELLHHYFDFPSNYAEGGRTPHIYALLLDMFAGGKHLAEWSTDHGKSLSVTKFFPCLSLMENPDEAHIVVCANDADAKRRVIDVRTEFEENTRLIADFPWLKKPTNKGVIWSAKQFTVAGRSSSRPNPSYYAATIGSNDVRQRRGKLLMDDIESDKVRFHAAQRRQLKQFIGIAALRTYENAHESSRPLSIAAGTPMDNDSVYFWLESAMDWKVSKLPAYTVDWKTIQGYGPHNPTSQWGRDNPLAWQEAGARIPDKYFSWPDMRLKVLSQDPYFGHGLTKEDFSLNFLLDPSAGDPTRLTLQQIQKLVGEVEFAQAADWLTLVCFDPASGSESRWADYCGVSVIRIRWPRDQKLPELQVLEAYKYTQGLYEQVDFVADLCAKFDCKLLYEINSQQGAIYKNMFMHKRPEVVLLPHFTSKEDKYDDKNGLGLTVIRTLVKSQRLQVPHGELDSDGMQAFMREVRDLGSDKSADHIAMSTWFGVRYLYNQIRAYTNANLVPVVARSWGGSPGMSWSTWRK